MLRVGTSSWKYDSWEGLVYEPGSRSSYLQQYARRYDTVEIDQWFWQLPDPKAAAEYAASVPEPFRFTIKVPNLITLTHPYARTGEPLVPNPHFLSQELYAEFLRRIDPLRSRLGALIFQFEYLNRQKMPSQGAFLQRLESFFAGRSGGEPCVVEPRNPRWLDAHYLEFLRRHGLGHCFLQGYYLPDIVGLAETWGEQLPAAAPTVIRLHGPDRAGMERQSGGRWDRILRPRDEELERIAGLVDRLLARGTDVYLNVNNHYEGCAPLTVERIHALRRRGAGAG